MSYSRANIRLAMEILSERKAKAELTYSRRREEITNKIPEIGKCLSQMTDISLKILEAAQSEDFQKNLEEIKQTNNRIQNLITSKLKENGYPEDYLEIPYTCKKCSDTGVVGRDTCSCMKDLLNQLNIKDLEDSSPAKGCSFENFSLDYYPDVSLDGKSISPRAQMKAVYEFCKDYADDFDADSGSIYMHGETGLGKTHLSLAIGNAAARKGYSVYYASAQPLLADIEREKFGREKSAVSENKALGCDLLIIDDLGCEFGTQFSAAEIYNIINYRINQSKPFIISTNLDWEELEKKYSKRVASRIIGSFSNLKFIGNDIRQIKSFN